MHQRGPVDASREAKSGQNQIKLDIFGLGGTEVRCKLNKTRSRGREIVRRSRLKSIFVFLFLCFICYISPLPSCITCLSNQKKHEGFEAKLGNSSSSLRRDDGGWDHRGRSLGDLTSARMIACSSQSRNCHFLCFISRILMRDRSVTLTGPNPESN